MAAPGLMTVSMSHPEMEGTFTALVCELSREGVIHAQRIGGGLGPAQVRIGRELDNGGQGVVSEGSLLAPNTRVAVKQFRTKYHNAQLPDGQAKRAFENECHAHSLLQRRYAAEGGAAAAAGAGAGAVQFGVYTHPNLCPMLAAYVVKSRGRPDSYYAVFPLLSGGPLKVFEPVPEPIARGICSGILSVLEHLHSAGLVHLDLKPGNIFRDGTGAITVIDLGMALPYPNPRRPDFVVQRGTAEYKSPEISAATPGVWYHGDLWAFGCILFELIAGIAGEGCLFKNMSRALDPVFHQLVGASSRGHAVMMEMLAELIVQFEGPAAVSPECLDLLARTLHPSPASRLTLEQTLAHPWFHPVVALPALPVPPAPLPPQPALPPAAPAVPGTLTATGEAVAGALESTPSDDTTAMPSVAVAAALTILDDDDDEEPEEGEDSEEEEDDDVRMSVTDADGT